MKYQYNESGSSCTRSVLLLLVLATCFLTACSTHDSIPYQIHANIVLPYKYSIDHCIADVDDDGVDDLILMEDISRVRPDLGGFQNFRMKIFATDNFNVIEQINIKRGGRLCLRRDSDTGEYRYGVLGFENFSIFLDEYDLTGNLLLSKSLADVSDRNQNNTWEGQVEWHGSVDADEDGAEDLLISVSSGYDHTPRILMLLDGRTLEPQWKLNTGVILNNYFCHIADIQGDSRKEFIIGTSATANEAPPGLLNDSQSFLLAMDLEGNVIWQRTMGNKFSLANPYLVTEKTESSPSRIFVIRHSHNSVVREPDTLMVIHGEDGSLIKKRSYSNRLWRFPVAADINGNGLNESIIYSLDERLMILDESLETLHERQLQSVGPIRLLHEADLLDDSDSEIVLFTESGSIMCFNEKLDILGESRGDIALDAEESLIALEVGGEKRLKPEVYYRNQNILSLALLPIPSYFWKQLLVPGLFVSLIVLLACVIALAHTRGQLHGERTRVDRLVDFIGGRGLVIVDNNLHVEHYNAIAGQYLGLPPGTHAGNHTNLSRHDGQGSKAVRRLLAQLKQDPSAQVEDKTFVFGKGSAATTLRLKASTIMDKRGQRVGYIVEIDSGDEEHERHVAEDTVAVGQELMHKIKTLLSVYQNDVYTLRSALENQQNNDVDDTLVEMDSISSDIIEITKAYLALSTMTTTNEELVDLNALAQKTLRPFLSAPMNDVIVRLECEQSLEEIHIDPHQIESLILNLVENALNSMEGRRGEVLVSTEKYRRLDAEAAAGYRQFAVLMVEDNGVGFDQRIADNLFLPGYSTFDGHIGMGLTVVRRIVENHKGDIRLQSIEGKGAVITVRIPYREKQ